MDYVGKIWRETMEPILMLLANLNSLETGWKG